MYDIVIFGTGRTAEIVESGLNEDANVVAYVDNNADKWNSYRNGRVIFSPNEIKNLDYDCIIIASQFNDSIYNQLTEELGVDSKKILQFFKYIASCNNHIINELKAFSQLSNEVQVIATGISYMQVAINNNSLCKKVFNLAHPSQDLYYDYNIVKYILDKYNKKIEKLQYVFIGLSYYSFQYDMSLSAMKGNVLLYYELMKKKHNYKEAENVFKERNLLKQLGNKIFKLDEFNVPMLDWKCEESKKLVDKNDKIGKLQAIQDCNKNYPKTVMENKIIFMKYLELLTSNNIKPIIIICPVSKYYEKYFSSRIKEEFYSIINEAHDKYGFQLLDYFNDKLFVDEDFYDVSHLNDKGSKKFSDILNSEVSW